ncbi:TPA: RNA polymerase sigma factor WhiG [Candidatus Gastranaerophilales bacterium HUM_9]|nr:MAG TPA: RNA polymerase sigma factor WhiG [Candidatus Gastranaerophilales bacterium HUM_9]HBX35661.1 RNA polymerase sigma factor WhiG [Cyanobacteria bacterium UBA11440]
MDSGMENENNFSSYNNIKRLSDEEIEKVWNEYLADKTNKKLRDILIVQYIYLTRYVVGRVKVALPPTFTFEDISSYGVEGLIDAVEKYSPRTGARFETYALVRIRGNIIDKIRSQDFLPRTVRQKIRSVKEAQEKLKKEFGRTATSSEVANLLGIETEKVDQILADDTTVTSIYDKKGSGDDSLEIIDTIKDSSHKTPHEEYEEKSVKNQLEASLKRLPERERMVMVLYYHENMTFKEIGETVGISESRVCQIHAQAIMKLKNLLSENRNERLKKSII